MEGYYFARYTNNMDTVQVRTRTIKNEVPEVDAAFAQYTQSQEAEDAEARLLEFVEAQITKMQKYSNLGNPQGMPGWYELNNALMEYNQVQTSLIGLDVIAKQEAFKATEALKDKQAQWYIEARTELNPISLASSKWASSSEIESYYRLKHHDELKKLTAEANAAECKVAAIRRLLDAWNTQSLILNRLCKNVEAEVLSVSNGRELGMNV